MIIINMLDILTVNSLLQNNKLHFYGAYNTDQFTRK